VAQESQVMNLSSDAEHSPPVVSLVLPARNEAASVGRVVSSLRALYPEFEIIFIDDGSTDETAALAAQAGATVVRHRYTRGNGASIKTGARTARGATIVFLDSDGQHDPADVGRRLACIADGHDMAVGARSAESQASLGRRIANGLYNRFASWIVGHAIRDLTSGFRAVNARRFREFLYLLPNGFSYPTTITMAFFRSGYAVGYVPILAAAREGKSSINIVRDGLKFLLIIFRLCTLYSPLKIFVPAAMLQVLAALGYYSYTYIEFGRFTNMSAVLFTGSLITFMFGLLSEQITALIFRREE
jgi:glycosyltransferase involved in cell wall biosynthesis